ncbi:RecX family transcriptional regulator [Candidatus Curtissbacteria bacterium]|nr:RecX family transcriptional regulator [Candidatus Curtissbacteria bacterium]
MPHVTKITPQKKSGRFNLFIDNKFIAGISAETVIKEKLHVGINIGNEKLDIIFLKEQESKLLEKVLRFLGFRQRSEKEVADYLFKKIAGENSVKFNEAKESPVAKRILIKLKKLRLIDDLEFAKWWVNARSKRRGKVLIRAELIKKGIDREVIEMTLNTLNNEATQAVNILEKKIKAWSKLNKFELKKKAYSYLARRGFSPDKINDAIAFFFKKE